MDNVLVVTHIGKDGNTSCTRVFAPEATKKAERLFRKLAKEAGCKGAGKKLNDFTVGDGYWGYWSSKPNKKEQVFCSLKNVER